jgi:polyphosphate kinase
LTGRRRNFGESNECIGSEKVWIDRDLSWLDFNSRVLAAVLDDRQPLLERTKFLAIVTPMLTSSL